MQFLRLFAEMCPGLNTPTHRTRSSARCGARSGRLWQPCASRRRKAPRRSCMLDLERRCAPAHPGRLVPPPPRVCQSIIARTPAIGSAADDASARAPAAAPRNDALFAARANAARPVFQPGGDARAGREAAQLLWSRRTKSSVSSTVISSTGGRLWPGLNTSLPTRAIFSLPSFESSSMW